VDCAGINKQYLVASGLKAGCLSNIRFQKAGELVTELPDPAKSWLREARGRAILDHQ